ncbi:MAG: hypothetical protein HRU20_11225 [Pseudomonadales bacterium]|nr:hypothetical protein [Pseudomonadales bacterium]
MHNLIKISLATMVSSSFPPALDYFNPQVHLVQRVETSQREVVHVEVPVQHESRQIQSASDDNSVDERYDYDQEALKVSSWQLADSGRMDAGEHDAHYSIQASEQFLSHLQVGQIYQVPTPFQTKQLTVELTSRFKGINDSTVFSGEIFNGEVHESIIISQGEHLLHVSILLDGGSYHARIDQKTGLGHIYQEINLDESDVGESAIEQSPL